MGFGSGRGVMDLDKYRDGKLPKFCDLGVDLVKEVEHWGIWMCWIGRCMALSDWLLREVDNTKEVGYER